MKCNYCNTENENGSKFCFNCGAKLEQEVVVEPVQPVQEPVQSEPVAPVQEPVVPVQPVQPVQPQPVQNKKKGNGVVPVLVVVLLLLLALGGFIFFMSTPTNVYKTTIKKSTKLLSNVVNDYDTSLISVKVTPKMEASYDDETSKVINKFGFEVLTKTDNVNKAFDYSAIIKYNNNELLNLNAVYKNGLYITLKDLLPNYIKLDVEQLDDFFTKKEFNEDAKYVFTKTVDVLSSSLKDSYFEKENETLTINGKEVKATANILNLNSDNAKELSKNVKSKLAKDKKFVSSYAKVLDITEQEVLESLNSEVDAYYDDMKVVIYTSGIMQKVVRVKFSDDYDTFIVTPINENNYEVVVEADETKVAVNIEYTVEYNTRLNIQAPSSFVDAEELDTTAILGIIEKLGDNKAYKELTGDIGFSLADLMTLFTTPSYDYSSDYNYDYDYDYNYTY